MSRHRSISTPTDRTAATRAYVLGLLACASIYPAVIGICHAALALGWTA
ncbi:hypothetical protein O1W68_07745 [Rhodococcus sp. H36-A4]|nr:hypothetical protein [Rhodococcus sp. H36-A4]MCZ4077828.1 hypothetical protein [Rhodococcus sp. H36-A4]